MSLSTAKKDSIELRRQRVAQLRLRGLSAREIADSLAKGGADGKGRLVNPKSGEAYTHTTVLNDLKVLKAQWREASGVAIDEHQARQFAEIQEVKKLAWGNKNGQLVLHAIEKEMALIGTMKQPGGFHLSINIKVIAQVIRLIEQRGHSAADVFEKMLQELQSADLTSTVS